MTLRGMKMIRIVKTRDVKTPARGNPTDAGLDFFVPEDFKAIILEPGRSVNIASGIKVEITPNSAGIFLNKSGVAKKGLIVGAQVIDCGYTGEVHLNIHNVGLESHNIEPGMKIAQMLIMPVAISNPVVMSDNYEIKTYDSERGTGAFGSTGTK